MTSSVLVREATPDDAAALTDIAARTFRDTFEADNTAEDLAAFLAETYSEVIQRAELSDPSLAILFAEVEGQVAGFAYLRSGHVPECVTDPDALELQRLYVDGRWHGRGVAQHLMTAVDRLARDKGATSMWLGVWERNPRAQAFYRKYDFDVVGSHVFAVGTDEQTDLVMFRSLPA